MAIRFSSPYQWSVPLILITLCFGMRPVAANDSAHQYGPVELIRDQWGTPHVFAETDTGAMYGLGYATAEDRAFQMHYTLRIIQGRLAEVIGDVKKTRRRETAVQNDRKMRTFGFAEAAKKRVGELDPETVGLLKAYAAGVNDYFKQNQEQLPEMFKKTGLHPEPWTAADCLLAWWHLAQFFATDGTRDLLHYRNMGQAPRTAAGRGTTARGAGRRGAGRGRRGFTPPANLKQIPRDDSAAVVGRRDVTDQWLDKTHRFLKDHGYGPTGKRDPQAGPDGPKFSHAWVADGRFSGTGSAVLVSMPQTNVANPSLFYEFHIRGKTIDARGIGVAGSPLILIGWNRDVAWGLTALGADQADLFRLKTDDKHPDQYQFDGQWRPIIPRREQIRVKGGRPQTLIVRTTHLGPIVNEFAFAKPSDPLVALKRNPICDSGHDTATGAIAMMRSKNVRQFMEALTEWRFPTANVLVGDRTGNIGYSTIGALPLRSPLAVDGGGAAHDGSDSKFDWQAIIPQNLLPHVINPKQGYLFSGNHRPVGSFYPIPMGISTGSMGDSLRSWRIRQLFQGKSSLSEQQLLAMFRDSTNPARQAMVRIGFYLRDALKRKLSKNTQLALRHLEAWYAHGSPSNLDNPGAELATLMNLQFRFINTDLAFVYGGGESGMAHFLKTVTRRLDADPNADVSELEQAYVERLLTGAWLNAERKWGPDPAKWNAQARKEVTERKLAYYGSLDGFPTLDPALDLPLPPLKCVDGATVFSQAAQAYVQWVPLAHVDQARSLLPPGCGESPADSTRTVNVDSWAKGQLHPAPLSRKALQPLIRSQTKLTK